jgi:hypothetical protein
VPVITIALSPPYRTHRGAGVVVTLTLAPPKPVGSGQADAVSVQGGDQSASVPRFLPAEGREVSRPKAAAVSPQRMAVTRPATLTWHMAADCLTWTRPPRS